MKVHANVTLVTYLGEIEEQLWNSLYDSTLIRRSFRRTMTCIMLDCLSGCRE